MPAAAYVDYAGTTSHYRILPAEVREAALAALGEAIEAHGGGTISLVVDTDLALARRV